MSPRVRPRPIKLILPDGRELEAGVVLTIDDLRDRKKTVLRMLGGSPQMILGAKDGLVMEDVGGVAPGLGDKVEVVGRHRTDMVVYYSPQAFSQDKEKLIATVNSLYANRLAELERERDALRDQLDRPSSLAGEAPAIQPRPETQTSLSPNEFLTEDERVIEVIKVRKESTRIIMETVMNAEAEKQRMAGRIKALERELAESVSAAQYSEEMERLENEFYTVTNRAMIMMRNEDLRSIDPEDYRSLREYLPMLAGPDGGQRLLDIPQIADRPQGASGLCEGTHVLVRYRPAQENKYFLGRLFFNDRQDYLCLGQGVEITSGVYGEAPRESEAPLEQVREYLASRPMSLLVYLDVLRNSSIQTVQFWLHYLGDEQVLQIWPVDDLILPLLE